MSESMIRTVEVLSFALEVPLADFDVLPRQLGALLARDGQQLRLEATTGLDCELAFLIDGEVARLSRVTIAHDEGGRFTREVLGTLLARYLGDFEARVHWEPERLEPSRASVRRGSSDHPLFRGVTLAVEGDVDVERTLQEARAAWTEYLRLKAERLSRETLAAAPLPSGPEAPPSPPGRGRPGI